MFFEPTSSPYDLSWRMLGTHVRVSPWFWLMTVMMGWSTTRIGFQFLVVWIVCVFLSILVHEFGHVLMGRLFGTNGHIVLFGLGGLAIGSNALSNRWQRIAVSFAGPAAGFLLLAVVLFVARDGIYFQWDEMEHDPWPHFQPLPNLSPMVNAGIHFLIWINLAWGLLNLLPIWPLDGGQMSRDFLGWLSPENGIKAAYGISLAVAGLLAVNALLPRDRAIISALAGPDMWLAILFGLFAFNSYQLLQAEGRRKPWDSNQGDW